MKLRYKINLMASGWCLMSSFVFALYDKPLMALLMVGLAWFNWTVALNNEEDK